MKATWIGNDGLKQPLSMDDLNVNSGKLKDSIKDVLELMC